MTLRGLLVVLACLFVGSEAPAQGPGPLTITPQGDGWYRVTGIISMQDQVIFNQVFHGDAVPTQGGLINVLMYPQYPGKMVRYVVISGFKYTGGEPTYLKALP